MSVTEQKLIIAFKHLYNVQVFESNVISVTP